MFIDDTIAAIATAPGEGGIGIIRISGSNSLKVAEEIFKAVSGKKISEYNSRTLVYGNIFDGEKRIDEVLVAYMEGPRSYTGEDVIEINCHGGFISVKKILELILTKDVRLAEAGEFTKRAFLNGRIDLSQAEAVIDVIKSKTDKAQEVAQNQLEGSLANKIKSLRLKVTEVLAQLEVSIDFSDEDVEDVTYKEIEEKSLELREEIKTISIVARSKPDSKMRIVQALQADGEVVAVTGDGINDAPALSKADVGIAMGISGTEVSKNAADIILTDDSFSTIVSGIKWGRGIYDNFQRFVQFQLTVNIIAFLVAIISQVVGQEMPFTTIQLLWVNIIMDGPPALALGLEPVRKHVLDRKPVNRNASIITKSMIFTIIGNALYITLILMLQSSTNILNVPEAKGETVMFGIFAFSALFNAFNCREFNFDSIIPNLTKNKLALQIIGITAVAQIFFTQIFRDFFNAVPLSVMEWIKIIALSFTVIIVDEVVKFVFRLFKKENKNDENMPKVEA